MPADSYLPVDSYLPADIFLPVETYLPVDLRLLYGSSKVFVEKYSHFEVKKAVK